MEKISTGSKVFDELLGGYEKDVITTIYGPPGSGKTCLCLLAAIAMIKEGKKVILIDTEGGFSAERFRQLSQDENLLKDVLILKPLNFLEQKKMFEKLKDLVNDKIGVIIIDTISMLYRLEMGKNEDIYEINRALGNQVSYLSEIVRKNKIPVLLTNQVYSSFDEDKVKMVGGDVLRYGSKCLIELHIMHKNHRRAVLRKHRSMQTGKSVLFKIEEKGIGKVTDVVF